MYTSGRYPQEKPTMLLRDVLENEYGPLRSLKPQARRQYQLTLTRWSETLGREPTMDDLQPLVVQAFLSARRTKAVSYTHLTLPTTSRV